jgi:hypothetical protein
MKVSKNVFMALTAGFLVSIVSLMLMLVHYIIMVPEAPLETAIGFGSLLGLLLFSMFYIALILISIHNPYVFEDVERLYNKSKKMGEKNAGK